MIIVNNQTALYAYFLIIIRHERNNANALDLSHFVHYARVVTFGNEERRVSVPMTNEEIILYNAITAIINRLKKDLR